MFRSVALNMLFVIICFQLLFIVTQLVRKEPITLYPNDCVVIGGRKVLLEEDLLVLK